MNGLEKIKTELYVYIDANTSLLSDISDSIWDNAELSLKEFTAAEIYCRALREHGFTVEENLCGIKTAFSGSFGSGAPVIGILAEFDALSGLSQKAGECRETPLTPGGCGHGCGHNLLGAGSFGAALAVKKYLEDTGKPGTVVFYGCPGEEGGAGKAFMAREGAWRALDAAITWHPGDVNEVTTGTNNSCIQVLYRFRGVAAHAAGDPFNGRSALDAVELMNMGVQFLREHTTDDCRIHYAIVDAGGVSPNVVQARASVLYMVRASKVADSVKLQQRVDNIAKGAAMMTDTEFERVFIDGTAELLPNCTMEKLLHDNLVAVGVPEYTEEELEFAAALKATYPEPRELPGTGAGFDPAIAKEVAALTDGGKKAVNDFVMPLFSANCFRPGSTDVGDVSWQTPTGQISAVTWPSGVPGHSWQIVSCGKSSLAHKGMLCAAKVLAGAAIDLLNDEELLRKAKEEFLEKSASGYVCPIEPDAVPIAL